MKKEDILDAIGIVDDEYVKKAKEKRVIKRKWVQGAMLAACFAVILLCARFSNYFNIVKQEAEDNALKNTGTEAIWTEEECGTAELATEDIYIEMPTEVVINDVWIYYVEGEEICKEQVKLPDKSTSVFEKWKEKNGIGEEVELIAVEVEDDATTTTYEYEGEIIAVQPTGTYYVYKMTVTENLQEYYKTISSSLLLQSLRKTMTEYTDRYYNEFRIYYAEGK